MNKNKKMIKKKYKFFLKQILLVTGILVSVPILAQNHTISGIVEDAKTGEKLIGASIYIPDMQKGTISNNYGFYSLRLPSGKIEFQCSFVGYIPFIVSFNLKSDTVIQIKLEPTIHLDEVTVKATNNTRKTETTQMGLIEIPMKRIKSIPVIMGEADILKTLQLMPGVQSGTEGSSGIYVRGGGLDQNLFLLDGVPVYNVNHLFGFFSVFNSDAIRNVKLLKGGFPARYGGRLSSVVDIRMKEGNNKEFHGEGSIGLISSKLSLEGPIVKDKTSFIVSGRRTYLDVLAQPFIKAVDDFATARYYFYDVNAKVNHQINDKNRIFLSAYLGNDNGFYKYIDKYIEDEIHYTLTDKMGLKWGNITTALRWNAILNNRLFCNTTITYSRFRFKIYDLDKKTSKPSQASVNSRYIWEYLSGINDYSAKIDFDYIPTVNHYIRFGTSYTYHNFMPGTNNFDYQGSDYADMVDTTYGDENLSAHEFNVYAEDDLSLTDRLNVNIGVHGSLFSVQGTNYLSLQPRISVRYMISDKISVKGSAVNMFQYIHLLTNTSVSLPTDLWVPATNKVKPQDSWQYSLGMVFPIEKQFLVNIEGYYKTMNNIIEYKDGYTFLQSNANWEDMVEAGNGYSYGMEFLIEKSEGRVSGWLGYTLSWSNRKFNEINWGKTFPYKYDRRHDINLIITYKLTDKIDLGATWTFGSGTALTLPQQKYLSSTSLYRPIPEQYQEDYENYYRDTFEDFEIEYYKGRNNFRMPSYHRLDCSINFHKDTRWGKRTLSLGLYNAYSHNNPFYIYIGKDYDWYGFGSGRPVVKQLSLFPVIPFINYNFQF